MSDYLYRWTQEALEFLAGLGFQKWNWVFCCMVLLPFSTSNRTSGSIQCGLAGDRKTWVEVQALLCTGHVSLGYFLHLSEPRFPHL